MAESEEELRSLLMRVKESEKADLKLNFQKIKITVSGPNISWQIEWGGGGGMKAVTDFLSLGSQITADDNCSLEGKLCQSYTGC